MNANKRKKKNALMIGENRGLGYKTFSQLAQLGLKVLPRACDLNKRKSAAEVPP
jgi:NAD(P)-dependent dehydrogenase (short-subunit alcohol dehydrogenase family)